jgi:hypothetical protein
MDIKTVPLKSLENDPLGTLTACADSGAILVVELPDRRLVTIQTLDAVEDDDLINDLMESNPKFVEMAARSKAGRRKPFPLIP